MTQSRCKPTERRRDPRNDLRVQTVKFFAVAILALCLAGCRAATTGGTVWTAGGLRLAIDDHGFLTALEDRNSGANHLAASVPSPLLALRVDGKILPPRSFRYDRRARTAVLGYADGSEASVRILVKETHLTVELISLAPPGRADLVVWGPYATTIRETIGETVGVVRGPAFALGIQALNAKTLGGYPWDENDAMPEIDIFEQGNPADLNAKGKREVLYRVEAAKPESFGSTLQAYCRDRSRDRVITNWGYDRYVAPRFDDGGPAGSKIALFGCASAKALETIGRIELAEGLPHPMIDGQWGKTAPTATAAYIILDFGEDTIDRALDIVERAGLRYLYHGGPFKTWGHFELDEKMFPSGWHGLKRCVEKAEARGIHVGVHTLSNFITTNDAYVTPVPDPRLAKAGSTVLAADVNVRAAEIPIESPDFFNQFKNDTLRTAMAGTELIHYKDVSPAAPWRLLGCERGAFGTKASPHARGEAIAKLADHGYKVFLADAGLGREMAERIAALFTACGLRQISFDGLEGNRSTGMGNYGEILFTKAWYDALSPSIRSHYIADASRTSHYFWHIYTRMNWGEPWYAGFRESQTEYRLKNQAYFRRNMMPGMLGWFQMKPETSLADVEWLLVRSAAFDAGYAFVTSFDSLAKNPATGEILKAIGRWEKARLAGAFSAEQKRRMEDIQHVFRLEDLSLPGGAAVREDFEVGPGQNRGFVILPSVPAPGAGAGGKRPWIWYAPTFVAPGGGLPDASHAWLFARLLAAGFAVAGVDVGESYGNPAGRAVYNDFFEAVTARYGLDGKACLLPQSRGGLMLYNWAAEHPDRVRAIGGIYTVCDQSSWPGLAVSCAAYGMTESELRAHLAEHNPIDRLAPLAAARVPILHLHGDVDTLVPLERNSGELIRRYKALGGDGRLVVIKGKGHEVCPEFFENPALLDFFLRQGAGPKR